jgi:hypothetical protein
MAKTSTVDACAACGKEGTSVCGRCKKVSYCGPACQKAHWKSHKTTCQLSLENVACCDACKVVGKKAKLACLFCGTLYCVACRDCAVDSDRCQVCSKPPSEAFCPSNTTIQAFQDLVKRDTANKRRGFWLMLLGQMYVLGMDGVLAQDKEKAKQYFEIAGMLNCGVAYNKLAIMYSNEGDWQRSKDTFEKGAALHDLASIYNLGKHHFSGAFHNGKPNYEMAKKWFKMGARLGDAECCYRLGDMYSRGVGTPVNGKVAASWFRRGSERGDPNSQNALGCMLIQGTDVSESFEEARYWLEKSAAQGNEAAIENLMTLLTTT